MIHTYLSGEDAVKAIKPGDRVFIHGGAATPHYLINKMVERAKELWNVELVSISLQGEISFADSDYKDSFYINSLFVSAPVRQAVNEGRGDYVPVFLSEIPNLFRRNVLPIDVALVQVSPPDKHGYCSLGVSVDVAAAAVKCAKHVIAQVNPRMPRTHGDSMVNVKCFNSMVYAEQELPEVLSENGHSETLELIGKNVASLIEDGATLQTGIGSVPDAVLAQLTNHKGLVNWARTASGT